MLRAEAGVAILMHVIAQLVHALMHPTCTNGRLAMHAASC
jgi:hypothetical protein